MENCNASESKDAHLMIVNETLATVERDGIAARKNQDYLKPQFKFLRFPIFSILCWQSSSFTYNWIFNFTTRDELREYVFIG